MKAQEAAQQARAAAAARARLARQAGAAPGSRRPQRAKAAAAAAQPQAEDGSGGDDDRHHAAPATTPTTTTRRRPPRPRPPRRPTSAPVSGGHPEAASIALQYLGIKYQWGGASPGTGFDCSGLVMYVYAQLGVQLPHFAAGQYGYGSPVPRDQLQPGDLVFFDGLSHVGIYIGNGQMVHAPQTGDVVKITALSDFGSRYVGAADLSASDRRLGQFSRAARSSSSTARCRARALPAARTGGRRGRRPPRPRARRSRRARRP